MAKRESKPRAKAGAKKVSPAVRLSPASAVDVQMVTTPRRPSTAFASTKEFDEVLALIEAARRRAYQAVNAELVGLDSVVLTPHVAGWSPEAVQASGDRFLENARRHLAGETPVTPV